MKNRLIILVAAPLLGASIANAALLVHYTFDDNTAANSGTGGDGTLVGGGTFGAGVSGNAWQGNRTGANDGYIRTGLTGTQLGLGGGDGSE
ncbi:MAG: hypothetical protein QNK80_12155, partial [Akkermansiaceae bacterium]